MALRVLRAMAPYMMGATVMMLAWPFLHAHAQQPPRHAPPSCEERVTGLMALVGDLRAQRNDQEWIAHGWKARADALQVALDKAKAPKPEEPPK